MSFLNRVFGSYSQRELKRIWPIADKVLALEAKYAAMGEDELRGQTKILKQRLADGETPDDILVDAFATCREASWRVLGMKHFPVQVVGGVVLHQGRISEMKTGEGKTLVATLPAYLNALSEGGVHIVTVNDYLAKRDSEWMGKVYRYLGLSVGLIVNGLSPAERKTSYAADITYGTNNEFGFDYLRDNMVTYKENQVQRGHNYAIVDEVDSILIDEARTPLIISGAGAKSTELYALADRFAKSLKLTKVKELDAKQDNDLLDGDYIVDEKARTATLTAEGVRKAERHFNVENLTDPDNMTLSHHINQAIKAVGIMKRDVDYVVKDGEVIIVDEFTGRLMIGRRYNEGLHQAIEAKEGVVVAKESKTLATITFQNYFRMYKKLAGMTGTALTEEEEFRAIYNLDVIEIPTNRPIDRSDLDDVIYQTEAAKFRAVIDTVAECHKKGQPVLVGTVSIERSELLAAMLSRRGIKHEVLNAKQHEREAQIVAQAGKYGAVTIATNMAGRGTDIMLGGNPEYMAKNDMRKEGYEEELIEQATGFAETADEAILGARARFTELFNSHKDEIAKEADAVRAAGGLYIIGTERHESRRIDNQLRGRSGRQGDPGVTKFFLSLEDDLLRLFGGERLQTMMDGLKLEEDTPIEAKILSNTIQNAQAKVESRNFAARKNVLQFDDVMNRQREIIYGQRGKVLAGEDISDIMRRMVEESVGDIVDRYLGITEDPAEWNVVGLREYLSGWLVMPGDYGFTPEQLMHSDRDSIKEALRERAFMLHENRERSFTPGVMREIERMLLLRNVDSKWMDHIDAMDDLKRGIYLRSYGQKDPVVEYRLEGSDMFEDMIASIREDTVRMLLTVQLRQGEAPKREQVAQPAVNTSGDGSLKKEPAKNKPGDKVGRNDPCPCGSGLKYKKCCGK